MKRFFAIILCLLFVLSPIYSVSYAETEYKDSETGVSFTIPEGWVQRPFMKEREFLKVQFATEDGALFQFGYIDLYTVLLDTLTAEERKSLKRTELTNDSLTAEFVSGIIDQPISSIIVAKYSTYEYYSFTNAGEHTFMRMDNGYILIFRYTVFDLGNVISQQRKNECESIMESVAYSLGKNEKNDKSIQISSKQTVTSDPSVTAKPAVVAHHYATTKPAVVAKSNTPAKEPTTHDETVASSNGILHSLTITNFIIIVPLLIGIIGVVCFVHKRRERQKKGSSNDGFLYANSNDQRPAVSNKQLKSNHISVLQTAHENQKQQGSIIQDYSPGSFSVSESREPLHARYESSTAEQELETTVSINEDDMIRFCRKCGNHLLPDSVYCDRCGTKVR